MTKYKLPNFLIVGMAKCGTTSLSQYIQQHPDVFISSKKEPRFITSQCTKLPLGGPKDHLVEKWYVKNKNDYISLFNDTAAKAVGEASADTLYYYKETIPFIKDFLGDPKILIILRNPVKRAFSAYKHLVRDGRESLSFEEGLEEEPNRIIKNYELIYHYKNASLYAEPVKSFMNSFSSVKVIINEDLNANPKDTLAQIFEFLGVKKDFIVNSSLRYNLSGKPNITFLHESLTQENILRKIIRPVARVFLPFKRMRIFAVNWLTRKNLSEMRIDMETKKDLIRYFENDIRKTEKLINRDLSHWLQ